MHGKQRVGDTGPYAVLHTRLEAKADRVRQEKAVATAYRGFVSEGHAIQELAAGESTASESALVGERDVWRQMDCACARRRRLDCVGPIEMLRENAEMMKR